MFFQFRSFALSQFRTEVHFTVTWAGALLMGTG